MFGAQSMGGDRQGIVGESMRAESLEAVQLDRQPIILSAVEPKPLELKGLVACRRVNVSGSIDI
jgi:hypothetical protein